VKVGNTMYHMAQFNIFVFLCQMTICHIQFRCKGRKYMFIGLFCCTFYDCWWWYVHLIVSWSHCHV